MVTFLTLPKTSFPSHLAHLSCTFFPKSTNLITQVDPKCLPVVVPLNSCISSYLDHVMAPLVRNLPSYIKDTRHALQIFQNIHFSGTHKLIFTMDIKSLYTVIPHHDGLRALKFFFDKRPVQEPSTLVLVRLAELELKPSTIFPLIVSITNR